MLLLGGRRRVAIALAAAVIGPGQRSDRGQSAAAQDSPMSVLWRVSGEGRGVPAADDTTAYFLSARHEVVAIDRRNGSIRWRQETGEPADLTLGSSITLAGSIVVAGDYDVYGFDRSTGAARWRFSPADGYGPGIYLGGAANGLVFAGSPAGRLYAIDASTGAARWSTLIADDDQSTVYPPITDGRRVISGYTTFSAPPIGGVVAFDASTGREQWRTPFPRPDAASIGSGWAGGPAFVDGGIVAAAGNGRLYMLGSTDGAIRWRFPAVNANCASGIGSPDRDFRPLATAGSRLFAGSLTGCVVAYDLNTRRELWSRNADEGSTGPGISADLRGVYVPYMNGQLLMLDSNNGATRWQRGGTIHWPPTISSGLVFVASSADGFLAFRQAGAN